MHKPSSLRVRRLSAGLRIVDIADRTGLSTTRISEIERHAGLAPRVDELTLIEAALSSISRDRGTKGQPS